MLSSTLVPRPLTHLECYLYFRQPSHLPDWRRGLWSQDGGLNTAEEVLQDEQRAEAGHGGQPVGRQPRGPGRQAAEGEVGPLSVGRSQVPRLSRALMNRILTTMK